MPRLSLKEAEQKDAEIRAYWLKQHEEAIQRQRRKEKNWRRLRAKIISQQPASSVCAQP